MNFLDKDDDEFSEFFENRKQKLKELSNLIKEKENLIDDNL